MKFTLYETVVYHHWLWSELANTGGEFKRYALFWEQTKIEPSEVESLCFPCEYVIDEDGNHYCSECIFDWPPNKDGSIDCTYGGLFDRWRNAGNTVKRRRLAAQIRDLPLKHRYQKQLEREYEKETINP